MIMRKPSHPLPFLPTHLLVGSVFLFASQFAVLTPATASGAVNFNLVCEFTKYKNTGYTEETAKGWIPEHQTHKVRGQVVKYVSHTKAPSTIIRQRTKERLEWTYKIVQYSSSGKRYDDDLIYTYFFTNNKVATKIRATGYRDIEYVWGTCEQIFLSKKKSKAQQKSHDDPETKVPKPKNDAALTELLPIVSADWEMIRANKSSVLFRHREGHAIYLQSGNTWFTKLHQRLEQNPRLNVHYAVEYALETDETKKYMFGYHKADFVTAFTHKKRKALLINDKRLGRLLGTNDQELTVSATDYNGGLWFSETFRGQH
jgi:hypothetical protein